MASGVAWQGVRSGSLVQVKRGGHEGEGRMRKDGGVGGGKKSAGNKGSREEYRRVGRGE